MRASKESWPDNNRSFSPTWPSVSWSPVSFREIIVALFADFRSSDEGKGDEEKSAPFAHPSGSLLPKLTASKRRRPVPHELMADQRGKGNSRPRCSMRPE